MQIRKSDLMRNIYGEHDGTCRDCCNLFRRTWQRSYYKCSAYGDSQSEATDWALSYPACGLYNIPFDESQPTAMDVKKHLRRIASGDEPLDGQIRLEV